MDKNFDMAKSHMNPLPLKDIGHRKIDHASHFSATRFVLDKQHRERTAKWRDLIAYWILGLCNNYGYVVMLSAAHDILEQQFQSRSAREEQEVKSTERMCNQMSTGAILLADILPALCVKLTAPFLPRMINTRVVIAIILAAVGFLLVAFATEEWIAILGVVCTSLSSGLGEVTLLTYSSNYHRNVVSTWSSGTGGAGIFGATSYAGLRQIGLSPVNTLLVMLVIPVIMAIAFWVILSRPDNYAIRTPTSSSTTSTITMKTSIMHKLKNVPPLMKYMIPLGLVYLFEYFINQGLFELVYFENIWLEHDAQYRWLQVDYQVGVFISRSSVNLIEINKIWIMALLQLVNVIIFTFEVVFYFIPNIWIIFALTLWEGLLGGGAYVNTFYKISKEEPEDRREFSMGITSLSDSIGITIAGFLAMPVHNEICKLSLPTRM